MIGYRNVVHVYRYNVLGGGYAYFIEDIGWKPLDENPCFTKVRKEFGTGVKTCYRVSKADKTHAETVIREAFPDCKIKLLDSWVDLR